LTVEDRLTVAVSAAKKDLPACTRVGYADATKVIVSPGNTPIDWFKPEVNEIDALNTAKKPLRRAERPEVRVSPRG